MQKQITKLDFNGENIYVGIDTHKKNWKVALYSDDIALKSFTQDPDTGLLINHLRKNYPNANYYCVYEAGFCGFWIQKELADQGVDCVVVNPADVPTTNKEKEFKTDPRDCRKLAISLRSNLLTPIHIPSDYTLSCRSVLRLYNDVKKDQTRVKNKIKSMLNFYGIIYPSEFENENTHWTKSFCNWLTQVSLKYEENTWTFQHYVSEYSKAKDKVMQVKKKVKEISEKDPFSKYVNLLTTIPGIALLTAMKLLTELEDIQRFKSLDQLCGYIGLVPTTKSSGEKEKVGEMTHRGNKRLKTAIIESAWSSVHYDPYMSQKYFDLRKRMEKNKAIVRIAKKQLARILYVLTKEQEFKTINV